MRYIRNQSEPLTHGWFSVKQPDSRALSAGITWEEARESERNFFLYTAPWNQLDLEYQNRLGTYKLVERLSDLLSDKIRERCAIIIRLPVPYTPDIEYLLPGYLAFRKSCRIFSVLLMHNWRSFRNRPPATRYLRSCT